MKAQRYTESQVIFGLREAWENITGIDDPFDANTRIVAYMQADGSWDELDLADVFRGIERFFGFTCSDKEWKDLFGFDVAKRNLNEWNQIVASKLTFGVLARFIADRAPVIATFEPMKVFGCSCAPAGAFTGIQKVAERATGKRLRFPPSARIIDVMRGNALDRFWSQLHWMTEHSVPELPAFWRCVRGTTGCLSIFAVVSGIVATWATSNWAWINVAILSAVTCYVIASAYQRFTNPVPSHIVTFRDLAMEIAAVRLVRQQ
jgi:hypothetical protein